jgi:type III pantothenate kinase
MKVICMDVGNSHTRVALVSGDGVQRQEQLRTRSIVESPQVLVPVFARFSGEEGIAGLCHASVVPAACPVIEAAAREHFRKVIALRPQACLGLRIDYPRPEEIGQDRLANAIGAQLRHGTPAIVIDMGTAVTLDVVSPDRGYEGGVIAPGLGLMTHYLHEKTAQLPVVERSDWTVTAAIGKSTREAISIGCRRGFNGMIAALIAPIRAELIARLGTAPHLIAAGGDAQLLDAALFPGLRVDEDITLMGLFEAFRRHADASYGSTHKGEGVL